MAVAENTVLAFVRLQSGFFEIQKLPASMQCSVSGKLRLFKLACAPLCVIVYTPEASQ